MSDATFSENKLTLRQIAKSRTFVGGLAFAIIGIAVTAVLLTGGSPGTDDEVSKKQQVMPVRVELAETVTSVDYNRVLVGEIRAKRASDLAFERAARIKSIAVDDGDPVSTGQALAVLDTEDLEIAKRRANAALDNAKSVQDELKQGARSEVLAAALADQKAFEAQKDLAEVIKKKREALRASNAISDEEYQQAELNYRAAVERWESAKNKYKELKNGTRQEKIAAQDALVKQLEAERDAIQLDIDKSTIKAPFDGAISMRYLDEGTIVALGSPVLRISENNQLEAVIGVPPNSLESIEIGTKLPIASESNTVSNSSESPNATVIRILPESDDRTRLIPVVIKVDSSLYSPGELVRVQMNEKRVLRGQGIRVKTVALVPRAKGLSAVYVVEKADGNTLAKLVPVTPLFNDGDYTVIKGPISSGDPIISGGVHRITNGQRVSILGDDSDR